MLWYYVFVGAGVWASLFAQGENSIMNEIAFQSKIRKAVQEDNDIHLAEAIYEYFLSLKKEGFISLKELKSFFIAARSTSIARKSKDKKSVEAVENILNWTGYTPDTIANILRTYERATPELKQARGDGRISREAAKTISRLHKGNLKDLQPRVLEMYLKYAITNIDLRELVKKLDRTLSKDDQEKVFAEYIPTVPSASSDTPSSKVENSFNSKKAEYIYLFRKITLSELKKLSEDELRQLEKETEELKPKATSILKTSLKHIQEEQIKNLRENETK